LIYGCLFSSSPIRYISPKKTNNTVSCTGLPPPNIIGDCYIVQGETTILGTNFPSSQSVNDKIIPIIQYIIQSFPVTTLTNISSNLLSIQYRNNDFTTISPITAPPIPIPVSVPVASSIPIPTTITTTTFPTNAPIIVPTTTTTTTAPIVSTITQQPITTQVPVVVAPQQQQPSTTSSPTISPISSSTGVPVLPSSTTTSYVPFTFVPINPIPVPIPGVPNMPLVTISGAPIITAPSNNNNNTTTNTLFPTFDGPITTPTSTSVRDDESGLAWWVLLIIVFGIGLIIAVCIYTAILSRKNRHHIPDPNKRSAEINIRKETNVNEPMMDVFDDDDVPYEPPPTSVLNNNNTMNSTPSSIDTYEQESPIENNYINNNRSTNLNEVHHSNHNNRNVFDPNGTSNEYELPGIGFTLTPDLMVDNNNGTFDVDDEDDDEEEEEPEDEELVDHDDIDEELQNMEDKFFDEMDNDNDGEDGAGLLINGVGNDEQIRFPMEDDDDDDDDLEQEGEEEDVTYEEDEDGEEGDDIGEHEIGEETLEDEEEEEEEDVTYEEADEEDVEYVEGEGTEGDGDEEVEEEEEEDDDDNGEDDEENFDNPEYYNSASESQTSWGKFA
jgi:hypothetical protein